MEVLAKPLVHRLHGLIVALPLELKMHLGGENRGLAGGEHVAEVKKRLGVGRLDLRPIGDGILLLLVESRKLGLLLSKLGVKIRVLAPV